MTARACALLVAFLSALHANVPAADAQPEAAPILDAFGTGPAFIVTATREEQLIESVALPVEVLGREVLQQSPSLTLDGALRASPAFGLFRRSDSLSAHPTTQGVSLRGLGPSGASRSLVLYDGVPLNDPFGGWVAWNKLPRLSLRGAEIVHGGGSSAWGNGVLGGAVQLLSLRPSAHDNAATFEAGDDATHRVEFMQTIGARPSEGSAETSALRLSGRWFRTNGFHPLAPEQRGPIDRALDSRHTLANLEYWRDLSAGELRAGVRMFDEDRGNGTPYQRNASREAAGHVTLALRPAFADRLDLSAYAQRQRFASGFSSVDDSRTSETPALDQFRVPATAWGAAAIATWRSPRNARTSVGLDARGVSGETREDFLYSGGTFLRRRLAGGEQFFTGLFAAHEHPLEFGASSQRVIIATAARLDYWRNFDGHRTESIKATGAIVRDDRFADRDGVQFNPSLGAVANLSDRTRLRAAVYRAFRAPTLNELHRPFRVGNVATDANPALALETLAGWDAGLETRLPDLKISVGIFQNDLHHAVTNVTLSTTPALTQRQRLNLDDVRVRGAELAATWKRADHLEITLRYLFSDARVRAATVAPALVGQRLAQVPRHTATLQVAWHATDALALTALARGVSEQFEDDENMLPLKAAVTLDLGMHWTLSQKFAIGLAIENAGDTQVETARTAGGLVSYGAPRRVRVACTVRW